jgi:hypothetical protein
VVGAECASNEPAIWASGRQIGHLIQICRDKKCPEHGEGAKASASTTGTKGGVAKPAAKKQSAEDKRRDEAEKAERAKLADKVKKESEYREKLFLAIAQVPDAQIDAPRILLLTRRLCYRLLSGAQQYGAELCRVLGWDRSVFDYNSPKLEPQTRGLTQQAALRAAALRLVVDEVAVNDYILQHGIPAERMEQIAGWLGIDVKAVRNGSASKPAVKAAKTVKPAAAPLKPKPKPAKKAAGKPAGNKNAAKKPAVRPVKKGGR